MFATSEQRAPVQFRSPWAMGCVLVACMASGGCNAQNPDSKAAVPKGTVEKEKLKPAVAPTLMAAMKCLAPGNGMRGEVAWDVALTLGECAYAVYSDGDDLRLPIEKLGAKDVQPVANGLSHGAVASDDNVVVIAFRGTNQAADWLTNTDIMRHSLDGGSMHEGFYGAVNAIFDKVYAEAKRQGADKKTVWVTGHSLGGAMAAAYAYRATTEMKQNIEGVVTFGQPLLFSNLLAQVMLDDFGVRYVRFVNSWDPVTRLLPKYHHAGSRVHLTGDGYQFRKPQISFSLALDSPGRQEVQPFEEDPELKPMTDEEYSAFEEKLRAEQRKPGGEASNAPAEGVFAAAGIYIPLLTPHRMGTYLENIRTVGVKHAPASGARVVKTGQAKE